MSEEAQVNETQKEETPPAKRSTKKKVDDTVAYHKTVGGRLKLKGVDLKPRKKKKALGETEEEAPQKTASELLIERAKKKSDKYCMV